jgi:hypothetical protein
MTNPLLKIIRKVRGDKYSVTYLTPLSRMSSDGAEASANANHAIAEKSS